MDTILEAVRYFVVQTGCIGTLLIAIACLGFIALAWLGYAARVAPLIEGVDSADAVAERLAPR